MFHFDNEEKLNSWTRKEAERESRNARHKIGHLLPEEVKEMFSRAGKIGNAKRWEGHIKQTPEERKAKRAAYMREYRRRKVN